MVNLKTIVNIIPVENDLDLVMQVNELARFIYLKHYSECINPMCAQYMYNAYQTPKAIMKAISCGEKYFIVEYKNMNIGYFAIKCDKGKIFLSKLYLHNSARGKGIGKYILNLLIELSKELDVTCIELFVSKTNPTVNIYSKLGFRILKEVFSSLENGVIENDYLMRLDIQ